MTNAMISVLNERSAQDPPTYPELMQNIWAYMHENGYSQVGHKLQARLSVFLFVCLVWFVWFVCLFVCLVVWLVCLVCLVCLFVCLSVCLFVGLFVCLFVCLLVGLIVS